MIFPLPTENNNNDKRIGGGSLISEIILQFCCAVEGPHTIRRLVLVTWIFWYLARHMLFSNKTSSCSAV